MHNIFILLSLFFTDKNKKLYKPSTCNFYNRNLPNTIAHAKLLSKTQDIRGKFGSVYYATFELDDGNRISLRVSLELFSLLMEKDTGIIIYKQVDRNIFKYPSMLVNFKVDI